MSMVVTEPPQWSDILADRTDDVSGLARRLRAAALTALPDLAERLYPGWHGRGLRHPVAGLVATIFAGTAMWPSTWSGALRCPTRTASWRVAAVCGGPA